jgi:hypothetical protein
MEVSGDKKSSRICLNVSILFFNLVPKLVLAPVVTYDEIYQALAVEGDFLLPKSFLDTPYNPDLAPSDFHVFGKLKKHLRGRRFLTDDTVKAEV